MTHAIAGRRIVCAAVLSVLSAASCTPKGGGGQDAGPAGSASAPAAVSAEADRLRQMLAAEVARTPQAVTEDDLSDGDVRLRRASARALARSEDPTTKDRLLSLLADEDPEVLAWAAFGLGQICATDRATITQRIVMRGATLRAEPAHPVARLDPAWAMSRALGRCGIPAAERTLVAWLGGPRARAQAAALGLGDTATRQRRIEEESSAALLRVAKGGAAGEALPEAFYPFGQLKHAPPRANELLLERARERLAGASPSRIFAVRALAPLGDEAVPELKKVLSSPTSFAPEERAEAARGLGKIGGDSARKALLEAVGALAPPTDPVGLTTLVGPGFPPLLAAVDAIGALEPSAGPAAGLNLLASLPVLSEAPAPLRRRITLLRCAAARALAGKNADFKALVECDPDANGTAGALARIAVLGRGPLKGARLSAWRRYLDGQRHARVREAALELIGAHAEIPDAPAVLAAGLRAREPGVVAVAAEQIAAHPDRAFVDAPKAAGKREPKRGADADAGAQGTVAPDVAKAIEEAAARAFGDDAVETVGQVALAAGAVRLESVRPWLRSLCKSPNVTLRVNAQTALSSLDKKKAVCDAQAAGVASPPAELAHLLVEPVVITFTTDVGDLTMTLDPALAPVAATRIAALARKGFYDGVSVHRVVAGFVVQFGDRGGDGYGGDGAPPLRCETSPVAFERGSVGIAHGGRDTGSSQVFVALMPSPHLDGNYTLMGKADGPWNIVAEGDVIQKVTVRP